MCGDSGWLAPGGNRRYSRNRVPPTPEPGRAGPGQRPSERLTVPNRQLPERDWESAGDDEPKAWREPAWDSEEEGSGRRSPRRRLPDWTRVALVAVGLVVLSVASALFFGSLAPTVYGARVEILYTSPEGSPDDARERTLATERELIRSRAVLADVSNDVGMPLRELQDAVAVDVGRDDLIRLTVGDEDPRRALTLAQSVASRYLERQSRLSSESDPRRQLIQQEIDRLTADDAEQTDARRDRVARLQDRLLDLQVESVSRPQAELLSPAYLLDNPLSPNRLRLIALGLVIGLLLATGVAVAMLRQRAFRAG